MKLPLVAVYLLLTGLLLSPFISALAADIPSQKNKKINFRLYDDKTLGEIGRVNAIVQDNQGFMWFGGTNGLARWDGYNSKIFQHNEYDTSSISTNDILDIILAENGDLWIATYWGLNRYHADTESFEHFLSTPNKPRSLTNNAIIDIKKTQSGELWIATNGGGLFRYSSSSNDFDQFQHDEKNPLSLRGNTISSIEEDKQGYLWVGIKNEGIDIFDPTTLTVIKHFSHDPTNHNSLSQNHVTSMSKDSNGEMWLGTYYGLNHYLGNGKFKRFTANYDDLSTITASNINNVESGLNGSIWVGVGDRGLALYNPHTGGFSRHLNEKNGKRKTVSALYTDITGTLWVGLTPHGVARIDKFSGAFKHYQHDPNNHNSLTNSEVLSVAQDKKQNLWVGTRNGLNYIDRETDIITRFEFSKDGVQIPSPAITALTLDTNNTLWIGSSWEGIARFDLDSQISKFYKAAPMDINSLVNREAWSLFKDETDQIWVGTNVGGLHKYQPKTDDFIRYKYTKTNQLYPGRIMNITGDDKGDIWLSTDDGLLRLPKRHQTIQKSIQPSASLFDIFEDKIENPHAIKLSFPVVRDTFQDSQGDMWLAIGGQGLGHWDRKSNTYQEYLKDDGLAHNTASAIEEDNNGLLWVSTDGGISQFNPKTKKFKNFTTENGLLSNSFTSSTSLKTTSGEIIFGGSEGLTIITPEHLVINNYQAPLVMTNFYIFNQAVKLNSFNTNLNDEYDIILSHEQSVFTFEFSLLNFDVATQNQYAYKLDGFDDDWTYSEGRRSATYTNLDPGNYVFHVKAANNEGLWMNRKLKVNLQILSPWWVTWWAYAIYILMALSIIIRIWYEQKSKQIFIEKQNYRLEKNIKIRTQELTHKNEELELAYKKMEEASYSDQLTGLRNRRYLYNTIASDIAQVIRNFQDRAFNEKSPLNKNNIAFYLLDVDHFKSVNDKYGHANGDIVLKTLADNLVSACRSSDIIIRWGGEEFLIVCRYVRRDSLQELAEHLRKTVEKIEFKLDNQQTIRRTCSIGYACFPFDIYSPQSVSLEQTIALADWCLYQAKNAGRNRWQGLELTQPLQQDIEQFTAHIDDNIKNGIAELKNM